MLNTTSIKSKSFSQLVSFGVLAVVLFAVVTVVGCGKKNEGKVLARFAGGSVTEEDFKRKFDTLPKQLQSVVIRNKKDFVEDLAAEKFLLKEAERRGIVKETEVKNLLEVARKKILVARLIEIEVDKKIALDADEAKAYYDAHEEEFMTPSLVRASHILLKTEEEARQIRDAIAAGADFEETARKLSIDTTAIRGGDLGFFQKGQLVPEFESAAFAMNKGDISQPLKTQFGYHIIKLTDRMEPMLRDFKAVRTLVEERLLNEKRSTAFKAFVERLKNGKKIEVDETALDALFAPAEAVKKD